MTHVPGFNGAPHI